MEDKPQQIKSICQNCIHCFRIEFEKFGQTTNWYQNCLLHNINNIPIVFDIDNYLLITRCNQFQNKKAK